MLTYTYFVRAILTAPSGVFVTSMGLLKIRHAYASHPRFQRSFNPTNRQLINLLHSQLSTYAATNCSWAYTHGPFVRLLPDVIDIDANRSAIPDKINIIMHLYFDDERYIFADFHPERRPSTPLNTVVFLLRRSTNSTHGRTSRRRGRSFLCCRRKHCMYLNTDKGSYACEYI